MTVSEPSEVIQPSIPDCGQSNEQDAPQLSVRSLRWSQSSSDYSWFATDYLGYFYRVSRVFSPDGGKFFVCGWTQTGGFVQSPYLYSSAEEAMGRMNGLASFPLAVADTHRDVPGNVGLVSGASSAPFSSTRKDERA